MTLALASLLVLAAILSLVTCPPERGERATWLSTLVLLGLGQGVVAGPPAVARVALLLVLAIVGMLLWRTPGPASGDIRWAMATAAVGIVAAAGAMILAPPAAAVALAVACSVALPLVPFHSAYISSLSRLPGGLPAFLAVLLPVSGFHELLTVLDRIPSGALEGVSILALMGLAVGSIGAFTRSRVSAAVAHGSLAMMSILTWDLAAAPAPMPAATAFLCAVGLSTCGLLLAWGMLRERHGEIGLPALGGVAHAMPRFAVLVSLLALAASGFPPFGVFSGLMGLLLAPGFKVSAAAGVVILAWFAASWYGIGLTRKVLFDPPQPGRRLVDLRSAEVVSLAVVVGLLLALGVVPR